MSYQSETFKVGETAAIPFIEVTRCSACVNRVLNLS